jgi:hypothetical protein
MTQYENRKWTFFAIFQAEMATPTKMASERPQDGVKMKNGHHHSVPHEKIYG